MRPSKLESFNNNEFVSSSNNNTLIFSIKFPVLVLTNSFYLIVVLSCLMNQISEYYILLYKSFHAIFLYWSKSTEQTFRKNSKNQKFEKHDIRSNHSTSSMIIDDKMQTCLWEILGFPVDGGLLIMFVCSVSSGLSSDIGRNEFSWHVQLNAHLICHTDLRSICKI